MDVSTDISEKWALVRAIAKQTKQGITSADLTMINNSVTVEYLIGTVYKGLRDQRNAFNANALDPALNDYVSSLRGTPVDVVAQATAIIAAIDAALSQMTTTLTSLNVNINAPETALTTRTMIDRVFSPAQTATLRTLLASVSALITT